MGQSAATVTTAIGVFASTNVDLFALLVVLFLGARNGGPRGWQVVLGQYLGFAAVVAASAALAAGLAAVPETWIGLLGLFPLGLGVRGLVRAARGSDGTPEVRRGRLSTATAAALCISVGGDNLSVYVVLFRTQSPVQSALTVAVFLVLLAVWCTAARLVATHKSVLAVLTRVSPWLVPAALVSIGAVILVRTGLLVRLARLAF
ncbi:cadmium resistance transporter [Gandjariella thermophila]|uniref:Cadmium transporter n=1 Tax=Gandjariella thermophila TaxID=1931992 RepID=A0A4D4JFW7_9PSEU|nr:cadmium resistance transporter [Gandjariella thermophila]GDY33296.1 cadmium transporter [Gandjariella thermophila]